MQKITTPFFFEGGGWGRRLAGPSYIYGAPLIFRLMYLYIYRAVSITLNARPNRPAKLDGPGHSDLALRGNFSATGAHFCPKCLQLGRPDQHKQQFRSRGASISQDPTFLHKVAPVSTKSLNKDRQATAGHAK